MADVTAVLEGSAPTNLFLTVMVSVVALVMGAIIVFGFQIQNLGVIVGGLVFFPLLVAADFASGGRILKSPATFGQMSFGYWLPTLILGLIGGLGRIRFSLFAVPSESYLSSPLANTPTALTTIINQFLAPIVENLLIIGFSVLIIREMRKRGVPWPIAIGIGIMPGAIMFVALHGVRQASFQILAFLVMLVMLVPLFVEDALPGNQTLWIPMSIAFTIGVHKALNHSAGGGYFTFLGDIFSAQAPLIYASYLIGVFELLTFLGAIIYTLHLVRKVSPF